MWAEASVAEGKVLPTSEIREALGTVLEELTWEQAMELTGMSRRALERVERGAYCEPQELRDVARAMKALKAARRTRSSEESD